MQPVSSNIKPNNKCLNPVTTKCVTWDGPEITCLDGTVLCKGQTIENTVYILASKLCEIYEAIGIEGIDTCINNIQDGTSVSIGATSNLQQVFSAIINKVCALNTRVQILENTDCPEIRGVVPSCITANPTLLAQLQSLQGWDEATSTLPIEIYANFIAQVVCSMLVSISSLQSSVSTINQNIQDLWDALNNCANNCTFNVQPTCTNNFTLNPDNEPVFISTAYSWLETDFCQLQSVVGTSTEITDAISRECANLDQQDRLSSGGVMGDISGWVSNPTTLADSLNNMWLTVCDMRTAVQQILDGCCFSLCSYLELGYDIVWAADGTEIDISFNTVGANPTIYTSAAVPPAVGSPYTATPPGPLPAWVLTQFPNASQTNIILTFDDGNGVVVTVDTGQTINQWAVDPTPFNYVFPPGYDNTSNNQTINISFTYDVNDGVTPPITCEINQTDAMPFECCSPATAPYDWAYDINSTNGTNLTVKIKGLEEVRQTPLYTGTITAVGANTITDGAATFVPATLFVTGEFGYIVEITSGPAAGTFKYVTAATATQLTVNSNWAVAPVIGNTYEVKNIYWIFPLNGPVYPCGVSLPDPSPLLDLKVQIVEVTSSYDPNDSSTWDVTIQNPSITDLVLCTTGYVIPDGVLNANADYVVYVYARYACDYSEPTAYGTTTPVAISVSMQFGSPSQPVSGVFDSSLSFTINNIYNNSAVPNVGNKTVTLTNPASFALNLPVGPNDSRFQFSPSKATFLNNSFTTPKNYAICGLTYNPWATTAVMGTNIPNRDVVLGLYRGYDVDILYINSQGATLPLLDGCNIPYTTNTLDDPNLRFINNAPFGSPCPWIPCTPAPPAPTCVAGTPVVIDIPSSFTANSLPVVIRYNPLPQAVDYSDDFHAITIKAGSRLRINNTGTNPLTATDLFFYARVFQFDPASSSPGNWVDYTPARYNTFTTGIVNIPAGGFFETILAADQIVTCKYGDAVFALLEYNTVSVFNSSSCYIDNGPSTIPLTIGPDPTTSQFSCNVPSLIEITLTSAGTALPITTSTRRGRSWTFFVTEDLDVSFDVVVDINT